MICYLEGTEGRSLNPEVGGHILHEDFANQPLEGQLRDEQLGRKLIATNFLEGSAAGSVPLPVLAVATLVVDHVVGVVAVGDFLRRSPRVRSPGSSNRALGRRSGRLPGSIFRSGHVVGSDLELVVGGNFRKWKRSHTRSLL